MSTYTNKDVPINKKMFIDLKKMKINMSSSEIEHFTLKIVLIFLKKMQTNVPSAETEHSALKKERPCTHSHLKDVTCKLLHQHF